MKNLLYFLNDSIIGKQVELYRNEKPSLSGYSYFLYDYSNTKKVTVTITDFENVNGKFRVYFKDDSNDFDYESWDRVYIDID